MLFLVRIACCLAIWFFFELSALAVEPIFNAANISSHHPTISHGSAQLNKTYVSRIDRKIRFEKNIGQFDSSVDFVASRRAYKLAVKPNSLSWDFNLPVNKLSSDRMTDTSNHEHKLVDNEAIHLSFPDSVSGTWIGSNRQEALTSYFLGSDPSKWIIGAENFSKIRRNSIYPGIDLTVYQADSGELEYDFIVAPGANPKQIVLKFDGAAHAELVDNGDLVLSTKSGKRLLQRAPVVYQIINGTRQEVQGQYRRIDSNRFVFSFGQYDSTKELIIDPVVVFSSALVGGDLTTITSVATDDENYIYLSGSSQRPNDSGLPVKRALMSSPPGGLADAFVAKFDPHGEELKFLTYIGGSKTDYLSSMELGPQGLVFAGSSNSADFPLVNPLFAKNPGDPSLGAGVDFDAVILGLATDGQAIVFSTFYGGSSSENVSSLALDAVGNIYIMGIHDARASDFPFTADSYQASVNYGPGYRENSTGHMHPTYLAKFTPRAAAMLFTTTVGSTLDRLFSVSVDRDGNAYVVGGTLDPRIDVIEFELNTDESIAVNANQPNESFPWKLDSRDGVIYKIKSDGRALEFAFRFGGTDYDLSHKVVVDRQGKAYIAGNSSSADFPIKNAFQSANAGSSSSMTITALNEQGQIRFSSFWGGSGNTHTPDAIVLGGDNKLYVFGHTSSSDFPLIAAIRRIPPRKGGFPEEYDCVIGLIDTITHQLEFSTPFSGSGYEKCTDLAVDNEGSIIIVGAYGGHDTFPLRRAFHHGRKGKELVGFFAKIGRLKIFLR